MEIAAPEPSAPADEVEIKLALSAEAADLLDAALASRGRSERFQLRAVYFDTPEYRLFRQGHVLRIRDDGGRLVQTIKTAATAAGLFERGEWEQVVPALCPVADPRVSGLALDDAAVAALSPVFVVETQRTRWTLAHAGGDAVIVDRCTIGAADRFSLFHEVEMEVDRGPVRRAFELASKLNGHVPLRISVVSKAERGFALLDTLASAYKAQAVPIAADMTAAQACARLIHGCLRHYRLNETILLDRHEIEAVHQARVALRRLRSALAIFGAVAASARLVFDPALRYLALAYGDVRDLDVARGRQAFAAHRTALRDLQAKAYANLLATLGTIETRQLFLDAAAWAAQVRASPMPDADAPIALFAVRALDRERRRLARRARHFDTLNAGERHRVRMAAKRFHYAHDFFRPLFTGTSREHRAARYARLLAKVQDRLGRLNDLSVGAALLAELEGPGQDARESVNLARAERALHRLLAAKPYWRRGR
jgi:inorganic triphosphatase YgiF